MFKIALMGLSFWLWTVVALPVTASAGGGWSVYIYNCAHPSSGWQRAGLVGQVDVSQAQAQRAMQERQRAGVSYERYAIARSIAQRVNLAAPNCGSVAARPTCLFYAKVYYFNRFGYLGGYRSAAEAQHFARMWVRGVGRGAAFRNEIFSDCQ